MHFVQSFLRSRLPFPCCFECPLALPLPLRPGPSLISTLPFADPALIPAAPLPDPPVAPAAIPPAEPLTELEPRVPAVVFEVVLVACDAFVL